MLETRFVFQVNEIRDGKRLERERKQQNAACATQTTVCFVWALQADHRQIRKGKHCQTSGQHHKRLELGDAVYSVRESIRATRFLCTYIEVAAYEQTKQRKRT